MLKLSPCKQNSSTCFTLALAEECIRAEHDAAKSRETLKGIKIKTRPKNVRYFRIIRMLKLKFSQYYDCPAFWTYPKKLFMFYMLQPYTNFAQDKKVCMVKSQNLSKISLLECLNKKIDCPVFHQLLDQPKKLYTLAQHRNILYCTV